MDPTQFVQSSPTLDVNGGRPTASSSGGFSGPRFEARRPIVREGDGELWAKKDQMRNEREAALQMAYARLPKWRRRLAVAVDSVAFERCVYLVLITNCLVLSFRNIHSLSAIMPTANTIDTVFTFCYVVEMALKIAAHGLGLRTGYLSRYWNWVDGAITIASAAGVTAQLSLQSSQTQSSAALDAVATLRLFRPLRMLTALPSQRTLLRSLAYSVKRLGNVALLTIAFLSLMSLIGLAFFRFIFQNECQSVVEVALNASFVDYQLFQADSAPVCVASGNTSWMSGWNGSTVHMSGHTVYSAIAASTAVVATSDLQPVYRGTVCSFGEFCVAGVGPDNGFSNFNNILQTATLLYTILSLDGWTSVMFFVVDYFGGWVQLYFIVNVLVGTIFVLNLVLATISDSFGRSMLYERRVEEQRKRMSTGNLGGGSGTAANPVAWSGFILPAELNLMSQPETTFADRRRKAQEYLRIYVLCSRVYLTLRYLLTAASLALLSTTSATLSTELSNAIRVGTSVFTVIFAAENSLELFALGYETVLNEPVRAADFFVTVGALIEVVVQSHPTIATLRAIRVIEVLNRFPALRRQLRILSSALRTTVPILLFMAVVFYIAALIGVQVFASRLCGLDTTSPSRVDTSSCSNVPRLNFDNIGYAIISVFVIFCGDGWRSMMATGMEGAGVYSSLYYCICYLIGGYVLVNLFIAVLLQSTDSVPEERAQPLLEARRLSAFQPESEEVLLQPLLHDGPAVADASVSASRRLTTTTLGYDEPVLPLDERPDSAMVSRESATSVANPTAPEQEDPPSSPIARRSSILRAPTSPEGARQRSKSVRFTEVGPLADSSHGAGSTAAPVPLSSVAPDKESGDTSNEMAHQHGEGSNCNDDNGRRAHLTAQALLLMSAESELFEWEPSGDFAGTVAEAVLADETDYDVISRKSDLQYTVEQLRTKLQRELKQQVDALPWIRRVAGSMVKSRKFDILYRVVVLYSMIAMVLGSAIDYPDSAVAHLSGISDLVVAVAFLVEALLKMIHHGWFHRKGSLLKGYFNYRWNIFDFVVMVLTLTGAIVGLVPNNWSRAAGNWLRISRVFRPYSLIGRRDGLRLVARAAVASLPRIRDVGLLCLLVWVVFSVLGTQLFAGTFHACTKDTWGDMTYVDGNITAQSSCLAQNYSWTTADRNFDSLGSSLLTMFQIATVDNWSDIMFRGVDSRAADLAPHQRSRVYVFPFFIFYVMLTTFFLIQVWVTSMCDVYFDVKLKMEAEYRARLLNNSEAFLDPEQKLFLGLYRRALYFVKPPLHVASAEGTARTVLRRVLRHWTFEPLTTVTAVVHIVAEALVYTDSPPFTNETFEAIDWAFTGFFVLTMIVSWYVHGMRNFLSSTRGRWSIFINACTVTGLALVTSNTQRNAAELLRQMRVFRLHRIFYVTQDMQILLDTIRYSLPNFLNVLFLLFLVFYLYAVIGMQLFGRVKYSADRTGMNRYSAFDRFDKALIVLLRIATFDDWTEAMMSCTPQPDCDPNIGECAPPAVVAYVYFLSFAVLGQWIGINFFTAEIIDAFSHAEMEERYAVQRRDVLRFQRLWKCIAGSSEATLTIAQFLAFLRRLGPPLGPTTASAQANAATGSLAPAASIAGDDGLDAMEDAEIRPDNFKAAFVSHADALRFMSELQVPLIMNSVLQAHVFDALMRRFYGVPLPIKFDIALQSVINSRFQTRQFVRHLADTHPDLDKGFWKHVILSGTSGAEQPAGGLSDSPATLKMAAAAVLLQARWRGERIRRLVQMALSPHSPAAAARASRSSVSSQQLSSPMAGRQRKRRQSVLTFNQPKKLVSIADRLRAKHSELL